MVSQPQRGAISNIGQRPMNVNQINCRPVRAKSVNDLIELTSFYFSHLFPLKKDFTSRLHSSSIIPPIISVLGWRGDGVKFENPLFSSLAPNTNLPSCAQLKAPPHIKQGSRVTYKVQLIKYLPPRHSAAAVIASISAWAVTSFSVSVRLCALAIIRLLLTITAPTGTSSFFNASRASFNACCIKYLSEKSIVSIQ